MTYNKKKDGKILGNDMFTNTNEEFANTQMGVGNYDYGFSQISLDGSIQVRNIPTTQIAIGMKQVNTTGKISINVGFKPKMIEVQAVLNATTGDIAFSNGISDGKQTYCTYVYKGASAGAGSYSYDIIELYGPNGPKKIYAQLTSFDSSGFTLNFTKCDTLCFLTYKCYR